MELFSRSCVEFGVPLDLRRVSQGISEVPKRGQATCLVWQGTRDCSRSNTWESGVISRWLGIHRTISHSIGDISVIQDLWGCFWGLSGLPSSKSRLLTYLIGNLELFYMQCRGIGPRLSRRGKSQGFSGVQVEPVVYSRVTAGMAIQLVFVQRHQDCCLVMMDTSRI